MDLLGALTDIAQAFSEGADGPFVDGVVISALTNPIYDGEGRITGYDGASNRWCRVQIDAATDAMRRAEGYNDGDVALIVLARSVPGGLTTDHRIWAKDETWMLASVTLDTLGSHYVCRGRRA